MDSTTVSSVDWADAVGATGYDVYLGDACPPPAYPHLAYQYVTTSQRTGVTLISDTDYCWKVVALTAEPGCVAQGPVWTFRTACIDPLPGAPLVTSTDHYYATGTTSDVYRLTFDEDVTNVAASLTWTPIVGSGAMGSVTAVDAQTYDIAFSGAADGDLYRLTVGTGVVDTCGTAVAAPVEIYLGVVASGQTCGDAVDVTQASMPVTVPGTFDGDPVAGGSCDTTPTNAAWFQYTAPATGFYDVHAVNHTTTFAYSRLAIFEGTTCNPYGAELACWSALDQQVRGKVHLTSGTTYLLLFYTDSETYTMVDPSLSILPGSPPPLGDSCALPATTSSSNHYLGASNEDCWSWSADLTNTVNDHDFSTCDTAVGADVVIEYTTGPTQFLLTYDATVSNTQNGEGYVAVEALSFSCAAGASAHCYSPGPGGPTTYSDSIVVLPSTTYYVWVADGWNAHHLPDMTVCLW
ncbi:MAG: hypothetical protein JRI23_20355 [Deltaproteobacteria bacterium]|nr:hypothetical protein [Deltaproteobacteria bacterium]MBW2534239.1 hypothetical protein [Deltaproteobacteria bacterium]